MTALTFILFSQSQAICKKTLKGVHSMNKIKLDDAVNKNTAPEAEMADSVASASEPEAVERAEQPAKKFVTHTDPTKNAVAIGEITEMRAIDRKVFRMSDGTEQAVFFSEPVHVRNEETGAFEDADNSLTEEKDGKHFRSRKNHFLARFSNEEERDELFFIEKDGHSITVSVRKTDSEKSKGYRPQPKKSSTSVSHKKPHEVLLYPEVSADTDVEYTLHSNGIKENIIVKKPQKAYRYRFWLDCEGLTPSFDAQTKSILFLDAASKEPVFEIPAPFMVDGAGVRSEDVAYDMKHVDGRIAFTVSAQSRWLNAPERVFPVVIDPQIMVCGSTKMSTYSWSNGTMLSDSLHTVGTVAKIKQQLRLPG